jgi:hypothetical protein
MKTIVRFSACIALALFFGVCGAQTQDPTTTYYPLAVGNSWKYEVHEGKKKSFVAWRVTKRTQSKNGAVFQVWPTPMESDDDALTVIVNKDRIRELASGILLVGNDLKIGEHWEMSVEGRVVRRLRVVTTGGACNGTGYASQDCITIADTDERLHLLTLTCYAKGIGPVWFKYYDSRKSAASQPDSTVEIISYRVKTDD